MKISRILVSAVLFAAPALAAEVWAPGVSRTGGWVDYNKGPVNDGIWADTGMCWAASASNVISWWNKWNTSSLTSSTNTPGAPWEVFRAVYGNVGSTPTYAYEWWIDGKKDEWGDTVEPSGYDETGFTTIEDKSNGSWPYGAFLNGAEYTSVKVYDTAAHPILVGSNPNDTNGRAITLGILDALEAGYALSLSAYSEAGNFQVAHAITLWGVEYTGEGDERTITKMWITDSDDGKSQLVEYSISSKDAGIAFSSGTMSGSLIRYAAGMWTDPKLVPEPASATLGLAALMMLCARRRRKA